MKKIIHEILIIVSYIIATTIIIWNFVAPIPIWLYTIAGLAFVYLITLLVVNWTDRRAR